MVRRQLRADLNALQIDRQEKESDIVGNRTGEQVVILYHGADQVPVIGRPQVWQADPADENFPFRGLQQAQQRFDQSGFPATRRAGHFSVRIPCRQGLPSAG